MEHSVRDGLSRAHYESAWWYDRRYGRRRIDKAFYLRVASAARGACLELGAGTGRVSRVLVEQGVALVAIEREAGLCARLRESLAACVGGSGGEGRFAVHCLDLAKIERLRSKVPALGCAIAPFNVFSHFFDAAELHARFVALRGLVRPGGVLAFDVPMPSAWMMGRDPSRFYRVGFATGPDRQRYAYSESFDYDAAAQTMLVLARHDVLDRRGRPRPADPRSFVLPLLQRWYFPRELAQLLSSAGWRILQHDGGFDGEPLTGESASQVIVAKRA